MNNMKYEEHHIVGKPSEGEKVVCESFRKCLAESMGVSIIDNRLTLSKGKHVLHAVIIYVKSIDTCDVCGRLPEDGCDSEIHYPV